MPRTVPGHRFRAHADRSPDPDGLNRHVLSRLAAIAAVALVPLVWSYWSTIVALVKDWHHDENYSVGELVPFAALYMLWQDREPLSKMAAKPCLWGLVLFLVAQGVRFYGLIDLYESLERYSMVLTVISVVLLIAGRQIFLSVKWILFFLFLMVPLPGQVHNMISGPLQKIATLGAVFGLELAGVTVARDGNVMMLNDKVPVAVAEACSGLRMLTAFVVVSYVIAYIVNRPRWQRAVLVVSSIPIAILCNMARLIVTAWLFLVSSSEFAEKFFHDFAGWTMMPLAVLLLMGELWVMSRLVIPDPSDAT